MSRSSVLLLLLLLALPAPSALPSSAAEKRFVIPAEARIAVSGAGSDASLCCRYSVTPSQARAFFRKAHRASPQEIHDHDHDTGLSCYVEGTLIIKNRVYRWRIRLDGLGVLTSPDGDSRFYALAPGAR